MTTAHHPTPAETRAHRRYRRRLVALGILPPRRVTHYPTRCGCGQGFVPGALGVQGTVLRGDLWWTVRCPACGHETVLMIQGGDDG